MAQLLHSLGVFQTKSYQREQHGLDIKFVHTNIKDTVQKCVHLTSKMFTHYFYI